MYFTPIATLLNIQKPIALSFIAWWPGGRTAQKAFVTFPSITASMAESTPPAAMSADS